MMSDPMSRSFLRTTYLLAFLTGAAGLVYQVVWQRYLTRLLGGDGLATATVLSVFLGGLSVGYWVCGRLTVRVRRVFVAYGILEAAIGIWAFAFPWLFRLVDSATGSWRFEPPYGLVFQGALCGALLLGPPALAMGGTIPMLTRGLTGSLETATRIHARVYAINTAGAAAGALLAGFVLIWRFGLPMTLRGTAMINLAAAAFFLVLGRDRRVAETVDRPSPATSAYDPQLPASWALYAIVFLSGFYFITLETLFVRVTNLSFGSSSYSFAMIVTVFILSIAIGAYRVSRRKTIPPSALARNHLGICLGLAVVFVTLDVWPYGAHLLRISLPANATSMAIHQAEAFVLLFLMLVVPAGFMGATLPLAFDALRKDLSTVGTRAGTMLSWNAAGNVLGGLVGGFLLLRWLGLGETFLLALGCAAAGACLAATRLVGRARWPAALSVAVVILTMLVFPYDPTRMAVGTFRLREPLTFSYDGPEAFYAEFYRSREILAYRDDPDGSFAVVENPRPEEALLANLPGLAASIIENPETLNFGGPRPRSIIVNGKPDSSTFYDRETLRLSAHLPALVATNRARVLVIGLGTGVTAGEFTLYPDVRSIDVAEISPAVVDFLPLFTASTHAVHEDFRVRIHVGDAFRVIRRSGARWNIIVSEPSNPWVTGVDQVFSREFYSLVREHLEQDGLFLQWVQRYSTNEAIRARVVNTLRTEFPHVRVFHAREAADDLLLASMTELTDAAFERIAPILEANIAVRESLAQIGVNGAQEILAREDHGLLERAARFADLGIETLDRPRIHYMSGLAFFRGDHLDE